MDTHGGMVRFRRRLAVIVENHRDESVTLHQLRGGLFLRMHHETLSVVAVRIGNQVCPPARVQSLRYRPNSNPLCLACRRRNPEAIRKSSFLFRCSQSAATVLPFPMCDMRRDWWRLLLAFHHSFSEPLEPFESSLTVQDRTLLGDVARQFSP
jgi:hypothetical protein